MLSRAFCHALSDVSQAMQTCFDPLQHILVNKDVTASLKPDVDLCVVMVC
jgi:hypothetical protein